MKEWFIDMPGNNAFQIFYFFIEYNAFQAYRNLTSWQSTIDQLDKSINFIRPFDVVPLSMQLDVSSLLFFFILVLISFSSNFRKISI